MSITQQMNYKPNPNTAASTDATVYGDLYSWGRQTTGYEKRNSLTIAGPLSGANLDANGQITGVNAVKFVTVSVSPVDWRSPQNNALWGLPKTVNDPCPDGWRVPTQTELGSIVSGGTTALTMSAGSATGTSGNKWTWSTSSTAGYKISPDGGVTTTLFLPAAGYRNYGAGSIVETNSNSVYRSSGVSDVLSYTISLPSGSVNPAFTSSRAAGVSVRCVKN